MNEKVQQLMNDSKATRWAALALVSLTMLAAYYFVDAIAPLELLLEKTYGWTPSTYGSFSGSEYLLNVCGFLILSGIILDKMGIRFTGLTACVVMLTGASIKAYGLSSTFQNGGFGFEFVDSIKMHFFTSFKESVPEFVLFIVPIPDVAAMPATAKLAAFGYAIFGVGVEMCGITVSRSVVKWFKGKEMALAMGLQLAVARMGASFAFWFSAMIAGYKEQGDTVTGHVLNPIYLGVALLCIGLLTFFSYTFMDRKFDKQTGRYSDADPSEAFHLSDLAKIVRNPGFWIIALLCVLFYSGIFPFLKYAVPMMQNRLGVSPEAGGWISGMLPVGTIILTPVFGYLLDTKGKGATFMILGSVLMMTAHLTFALAPLNTALAIVAIMVLGVAFSLIPASMWPSVPKIVDERYLGSAFALVFWIQNIGLGAVPAIIGKVLEKANPGVAQRIAAGDTTAVYDYTIPMLCFAGLGVAAILLSFALKAVDKKKGYGLELPNKKKAEEPAA